MGTSLGAAVRQGSACVILACAVSGCGVTQWSDDARVLISERGAAAAETTAENLEFGLCRALPVGTVFRRYGDSEETWRAYRTFCTRENARTVIDSLEGAGSSTLVSTD